MGNYLNHLITTIDIKRIRDGIIINKRQPLRQSTTASSPIRGALRHATKASPNRGGGFAFGEDGGVD